LTWKSESMRHSLSAKKIKTGRKQKIPLSDVWELETPPEKVASEDLSMIADMAIEGDRKAQNYLKTIFEEDWKSIKEKLQTEGSAWYVWWMDGVRKHYPKIVLEAGKPIQLEPEGLLSNVFLRKVGNVLVANIEPYAMTLTTRQENKISDLVYERQKELLDRFGGDYVEINIIGRR